MTVMHGEVVIELDEATVQGLRNRYQSQPFEKISMAALMLPVVQ